MPAGMGEEDRFAAAVEYGTIPGSIGGDVDSADDLAYELELVALLRSAGPALAPEPAARERARQRLMTAFAHEFGHDDGTEATGPLQVVAPVALASRPETPEHPAEPTPSRRDEAPTARPRRAGRHSAPELEADLEADAEPEPTAAANVHRLRPRRSDAATPERGGHRRAALLGAAAAAALVALAGTGTFASRDALPGDQLYAVKRVAESTGYALTFGEQAKARRHLEQAQRRLDEVEGMVARDRATAASGTPEQSSDAELVQSTMQEFDADASEGSRLLLAGESTDPAEVDEVRDWATEQSARLSEIRSTLPAPDRADESLALLDQVLDQTASLSDTPCDPAAGGTTGGDATADPACAPQADREQAPDATDRDPGATSDDDPTTGQDGNPARERSGDADEDVDGTADGDGDSVSSTVQGSSPTGTSNRRGGGDDQDGSGESGGSGASGSSGGSGASGGGSGGAGGSGGLPLPLPVNLPGLLGGN